MCGVFVAFSKKDIALDLDKCRLSLDKMSHRGPDFMFDSLQFNGRLYMGQTILSITGSPDPELFKYHVSNKNRFNLVLNGEIYNYEKLLKKYLSKNILTTRTDTEVLVNLYENLNPKKIASKLDGMYAYSVYDRERQKLYISRDLIGEKVLYRYEDDNVVLFASETSTIIHFLGKCKINSESLYQYFYSRHLLAPEHTEFQGIEVFPAGHSVVISLPECTEETIYSEVLKDLINAEKYEHLNNMSESEVLDELDCICRNSAKKLMPSVKYASVFSGGVDSSIASWYMLQQQNKPTLLTGLVFGEKDPISRKLNLFEKKINTSILSTEVSEQWFTETMKEFYDEYKIVMPTHSFVSQMILSKTIKDHNCKVLIGGDGADELFGGYEHYKKFKYLEKSPKENMSPYSGFVKSEIDFQNYNSNHYRRFKSRQWNQALELFSHIKDKRERALQCMLYLDSLIEMETVGLRSSDLMSMAHSIEGRSFFVTREMLEFSVNLPIKYKINFDEKNPLLVTKPLLKKLFIKIFGEELLFDKQGYSGYPNEAAKKLLKGEHALFSDRFKTTNHLVELNKDKSLEWKIMNVEMFLRSIQV